MLTLAMSIAVAAVVRPSRCLRGGACVLALAYLAAALAVWSGGLASRLPGGIVVGACLVAAACLIQVAARRQTCLIDVSGTGVIRLAVQRHVGPAQQGAAVELLPGSTLWPACLVLRLRSPDRGPVHTLVVMPDSVGREQFRCLAVAMRRIARMPDGLARPLGGFEQRLP
jgi:toxin CptA